MMQLKNWHQIRLKDIPLSPWKNGGGITQELLCWPNSSQWVFRMSVARVDKNGPFSEFKGVERWFAVIRGEGVVLQFPHKRVVLNAMDMPLQFSGETPCECSLINGSTIDFNLMVQGVVANMTRICRTPHIGHYKAKTTLGIFVLETDGHVQIQKQAYELNSDTLYWITLDQDEQIQFDGMHVLLMQLECLT